MRNVKRQLHKSAFLSFWKEKTVNADDGHTQAMWNLNDPILDLIVSCVMSA